MRDRTISCGGQVKISRDLQVFHSLFLSFCFCSQAKAGKRKTTGVLNALCLDGGFSRAANRFGLENVP